MSSALPRTIVGTLGTIKVLLLSYSVNQCIIIHGKLPITLNININWKNTYHWTDNSNFFPRMEWQSIFETKRIYSMNVKYSRISNKLFPWIYGRKNIVLFLYSVPSFNSYSGYVEIRIWSVHDDYRENLIARIIRHKLLG